MSFAIDAKQRSLLVSALARVLSGANVTFEMLPLVPEDDSSFAVLEILFDFAGEDLTKLDGLIARQTKSLRADGVPSFGQFLHAQLRNAVPRPASDRKPRLLLDLLGVSDASALAEQYVSRYETLPWPFRMVTALPGTAILQPLLGSAFAINDELVLRRLSPEELADFRESYEENVGPLDRAFETDYVLVSAIPECDLKHFDLYDLSEAETCLMQFFGLCVATGLLEPPTLRHHHATAPHDDEPYEGTVFFQDSRNPKEWVCNWFLPLDRELFGSMQVPKDRISPLNSANSAELRRCKGTLHLIGAAFRHRMHRLLNAGEWFLRSFVGNELLQLVQATTTLEILLGGSEAEARQVGLVKLLANRCAYLLGSTPSRREAIIREFQDIYDTRSRIVHSGRNRIDADKIDAARHLCKRVIERELKFLGEA